jgi:hypothetical protein
LSAAGAATAGIFVVTAAISAATSTSTDKDI